MKNLDLTAGNVKTTLLRFAVPFLASSLLQALYGATDLYVVGRFDGASAISAVNIGSQIMQIITSFVIGCSMGSTVLIALSVGQKDGKLSSKATGSTVTLFAVMAVVLTPCMLLLAEPIVTLMKTPADALAEADTYVSVCSMGIPFIIAFNVCAAVLRGIGDSKTPMKIVGVAAAVNVVGDFFLTGALDMGVFGVAIATACAQAISSIYGIIIIMRHGLGFAVDKADLKPDFPVIGRILKVGVPIAVQDTLINISFMIITVIANTRGLIASSAVGVVEKIILFMFLVPSALLSSISAMTAQNVGAGKPERAAAARNFGIAVGVSFGCLMCALSWLRPELLTGIFTSDADVILQANEYIKTYSIDCILVGVVFCINGYLSGMSKSLVTFAHSTASIFLVRIPAAYLLSRLFPDTLLPMGLASPLGSVMSIIILAVYFRVQKRRGEAL